MDLPPDISRAPGGRLFLGNYMDPGSSGSPVHKTLGRLSTSLGRLTALRIRQLRSMGISPWLNGGGYSLHSVEVVPQLISQASHLAEFRHQLDCSLQRLLWCSVLFPDGGLQQRSINILIVYVVACLVRVSKAHFGLEIVEEGRFGGELSIVPQIL
jgi:hypothetical protein